MKNKVVKGWRLNRSGRELLGIFFPMLSVFCFFLCTKSMNWVAQ